MARVGAGGRRTGAGAPKKKDKKEKVMIRIYDTDRELLEDVHGSVQKGVDAMLISEKLKISYDNELNNNVL